MQVQEDFKPRESRRHPGLSRHFWELKADQVLNKVFDQQHAGSTSTSSKAFTDVEILNFKPHQNFHGTSDTQQKKATNPAYKSPWPTIGVSSVIVLSLAIIHLASEQRRSLIQEQNLRILSQLRENNRWESNQANQSHQLSKGDQPTSSSLPPAPPGEEWIEELAKLPPSNTGASDLLKVPLNETLQTSQQFRPSSQPPITTTSTSKNGLPQLLGTIQGAGTKGAAIVQWDGTSANVNIGEAIGTSGWLLKTASGNSAVIERGGTQRRISINAGS